MTRHDEGEQVKVLAEPFIEGNAWALKTRSVAKVDRLTPVDRLTSKSLVEPCAMRQRRFHNVRIPKSAPNL